MLSEWTVVYSGGRLLLTRIQLAAVIFFFPGGWRRSCAVKKEKKNPADLVELCDLVWI